MSLNIYAKALQDRLNNEALQSDENEFIKIYDGTLGEYLTNHDNHFLDVFLLTASGDYLDIHADIFGLKRRENETDEEFRQRIKTDELLIERTTDFEKLDCQLWIYKDGVTDNDTLTSRNTYLKDEHDENYVFIGTGTDSEYIQSKFLLGDILWLI